MESIYCLGGGEKKTWQQNEFTLFQCTLFILVHHARPRARWQSVGNAIVDLEVCIYFYKIGGQFNQEPKRQRDGYDDQQEHFTLLFVCEQEYMEFETHLVTGA